ncbi:MAG: 2-C-methyl-D-erythritol 4-phosphate cytidylyltransferase [Lachnospiraceae bacterium]|nr:2-C-methyl-D-erythritol 4-phosphate cytidylyltransferase [Lachnospiraceae bacterium]
MNEIKVELLQKKMLEMLLYFDEFCAKKSLKYYLCGGCLIGIVRHHGFIPWDDDIDLFMPRPDYEKLALIWNQYADTNKYVYCRTDETHVYHDAGASVRDIRTTYINRHSVNEDIVHGIALEIMPIDGCPSSVFSRSWQLLNAFLFGLYNVQRLPDSKGRLIRNISYLLYKIVPSKQFRYKIWKYAEKEMTKYHWDKCKNVTELIGSIKGMMLKHKKEDFENIILLDFEGHKIPVMAGYKKYLTEIWGDYMKLPPVEKRVAKHDVVYMSLDKPYVMFKGIYYCKGMKK